MSELPVPTRLAVLEEKDRQLRDWKRGRKRWEEDTDERIDELEAKDGELARAIAVLQVKVAIYAALGAALGGGAVALLVYLVFNALTGTSQPVKP